MADSCQIEYFLGANSPSGFTSLYHRMLEPERASRIYILKGGAGCGKSTLMRQVGEQARLAGEAVEYILCSGDPSSLDAVIFPRLRAAVVDGTAPHVVEPKYPGLVEQYVNLGACYDREGLSGFREAIFSCMRGYKGCYNRAYRFLRAAEELREDARAILVTPELEARLAKRARGILSREIKPSHTGEKGEITPRFLSAVTHRGQLCLYGTALAQCPRVYLLTDDGWGLSHLLLTHLLSGAAERGWDVVACPDPMSPQRLEHLLLPGLGLAFLTQKPGLPCPGSKERRLRLEHWTDPALVRQNRARLRFSKKMSAALVEEAVASLAQAKEMHDELEAIYNPWVDFRRVRETASLIARELLE